MGFHSKNDSEIIVFKAKKNSWVSIHIDQQFVDCGVWVAQIECIFNFSSSDNFKTASKLLVNSQKFTTFHNKFSENID